MNKHKELIDSCQRLGLFFDAVGIECPYHLVKTNIEKYNVGHEEEVFYVTKVRKTHTTYSGRHMRDIIGDIPVDVYGPYLKNDHFDEEWGSGHILERMGLRIQLEVDGGAEHRVFIGDQELPKELYPIHRPLTEPELIDLINEIGYRGWAREILIKRLEDKRELWCHNTEGFVEMLILGRIDDSKIYLEGIRGENILDQINSTDHWQKTDTERAPYRELIYKGFNLKGKG